MNLAGNQAKQLFKSLRTGSVAVGRRAVGGRHGRRPAAQTQRSAGQRADRQQETQAGRELCHPDAGQAEEGSLAESLAPGTRIAEIETSRRGIDRLATVHRRHRAASGLPAPSRTRPVSPQPPPTTEGIPRRSRGRRQRHRGCPGSDDGGGTGHQAHPPPTPQASQRSRGNPARRGTGPEAHRRQRRKLDGRSPKTQAPTGVLASTLVDVAASFMGSEEDRNS